MVAETQPEACRLARRLANNLDELPSLAAAVEELGAEAGWNDAEIMQINLVLEELIVNTITYGYPDGRDGLIDVLIEAGAHRIRVSIADDGDPFDPFVVEAPDLTGTISERAVGGLGIYLVRHYMDSYDYRYAQNRNRIVLIKQLHNVVDSAAD